MALNVEHLVRTAPTLEQALLAIGRKALKAYGGSARSVDALVFNDVLRQAGSTVCSISQQ